MEEIEGLNARIKIKEAVVVEGRYDKIKLSSILDATIIETNGFRIFKDKEKMALLRALAEKKGLIVLTDSDAAGFKIRHHIAGSIDPQKVKHVYIPDILGKEKRKDKPSKEGKLGVEGISRELILRAFQKSGILYEERSDKKQQITKVDLYEDGLTGRKDSDSRRKVLLKHCGLPAYLNTNAFLEMLNAMMDYEEYQDLIKELF